MEHKTPLTLDWKLHTVMSDRGIRTATDLHRRLQHYGIALTSHQLSRIVSKLPARLNTELLAALLTELNCTPNDLFRLVDVQAVGEASAAVAPTNEPAQPPKATAARSKKVVKARLGVVPPTVEPPGPALLPEVPDMVLGPKVTKLPKRPPKE